MMKKEREFLRTTYSLGVPGRVRERLGQTPCHPGYLPVYIVSAPDLIDAPRNQRVRLLSHVIFCFEQIMPHQFSE